jgi:SAM-dependent methyltransferase
MRTSSGAEINVAASAGYTWREQRCPLCVDAPPRRLGRRGGEAHRLGLGVACAIYQCRGCGLIFPNPMPIPFGLGDHYGDADKYFSEHDFDGKVAAYRGVLTTIEEFGVKGRLLDIGAGRGESLKAAKDKGWEAVGLEPSSDFARAARLNSGAEVVEARLEQRPFEENSFDAVTLGAVLEHVFEPTALLAEIHRVLKPEGILWLDVPNEAGAFYAIGNMYQRLRGRDWVVNLSPTFPPYHVFGFTPPSLRRLLQATGFETLKLKTYATTAVIATSDSPVPLALRDIVSWTLRLGAFLGAGTYMDAWAAKR